MVYPRPNRACQFGSSDTLSRCSRRSRLHPVEVGQARAVGLLGVMVGQQPASRSMVRVVGQNGHGPFHRVFFAAVLEAPGDNLRPGIVVVGGIQERGAQASSSACSSSSDRTPRNRPRHRGHRPEMPAPAIGRETLRRRRGRPRSPGRASCGRRVRSPPYRATSARPLRAEASFGAASSA